MRNMFHNEELNVYKAGNDLTQDEKYQLWVEDKSCIYHQE